MQDKAFDRAKTTVAYCASSERSALSAAMGYDKVLSLGGFKGWSIRPRRVDPELIEDGPGALKAL